MAKNVKELRKQVLDYMRSMSEIEWIAEEDVDLSVIRKPLYYTKGEKYYGTIYNTNEGVDLETFAKHVVDGVFKGPFTKKECPGNHCTSTILISWRKFGDKNTAHWTVDMMPQCKTGILPLGNFSWNDDDTRTIDMVERTDADTLYEAFALMQEADAILYCFGPTGHARMIVENHVIRDENGKINGDESYIISIEQTSSFDKIAKEEKGINTTWYVDHKYTYSTLREKNYVPVTVALFNEDEE